MFLLIGLATGMVNCKKKLLTDDAPISPRTGTRKEFTLDSVFLYARQIYLWNEVLPSYAEFNPRAKYGSLNPDFTAFRQELFDITQLKKNPVNDKPYEFHPGYLLPKYSNIQPGKLEGGKNAAVANGSGAIFAQQVLNNNGKPVAYLALGSFPKLSSCKQELDAAFAVFATAGPADIVIDLRSNAGGYIETAEYLANLLIPNALNGKVMYTEQYNATMRNGQASILKHQPYLDGNGKTVMYNGRLATMADVDYTESGNTYKFSKKGNLSAISNVYFIVTGVTASASELLISCLKPYLNVRLAGEQTYGKPVGFFGIQIAEYTLYLSGFLIRNANGWSDYFDGIPVDIPVAPQANAILGDPSEPCLNAVISSINGKVVSSAGNTITNRKIMTAPPVATNTEVADVSKGLIENRFRLKE